VLIRLMLVVLMPAGRALTRNHRLAFLAMLVVAAPSIYDAATVAAATRVTPSFS
jgi:hypothetical protein